MYLVSLDLNIFKDIIFLICILTITFSQDVNMLSIFIYLDFLLFIM